jgi:hypothetical protein
LGLVAGAFSEVQLSWKRATGEEEPPQHVPVAVAYWDEYLESWLCSEALMHESEWYSLLVWEGDYPKEAAKVPDWWCHFPPRVITG